jgi:putative transposase
MLAAAIDNEVSEYIAAHADQRDDEGRRLVVRNGHLPQRSIQTGPGPIAVRQPRVNDRRTDAEGNRIRFTSKILPSYLRRTEAIDELIPWLYLRGISTGDFSQALEALLGPQAKGLSPTNIVQLKESWQQEWKAWLQRSLAGQHAGSPHTEDGQTRQAHQGGLGCAHGNASRGGPAADRHGALRRWRARNRIICSEDRL